MGANARPSPQGYVLRTDMHSSLLVVASAFQTDSAQDVVGVRVGGRQGQVACAAKVPGSDGRRPTKIFDLHRKLSDQPCIEAEA